MRQFFLTIPFELDEAALIDGANKWTIYTRVILPLSKPVLATVVAFSVIGTWNEFLGPLIYLTNPSSMVVAVALSMFRGQQSEHMIPLLMAASTMAVAPIVLVFMAAQQYFVVGVTMTGLREG
jgi:multiple sugar transport system permease protein